MTDAMSAADVWRGLADGSIPAVVDLRNPEDRAAVPFEGPPGTEVIAAPLWRVLGDS
jgi:hypothetical protein